MTQLNVDVDGDKKPDFQVDFKTLIMAVGMVVSLTLSYAMLKTEIEVAKTMPKPIISQDDTRVVNQKLDFLDSNKSYTYFSNQNMVLIL